ncbi:MAG: dihydrolipoyl dehydrogenase [Methyloceanibacter sp.]|uniref:dihydrolipoyl dehydrogenase n=1 Tax=Methyloceanibacter sp. TaxID=1965321 RepID=UPI003D6D31BF
MSDMEFDLAVIGAGPGGYVAAIRAAQLGMKTAIVERDRLGGICLNWGCIPTKALLRTSEIYHLMQNASEFGLRADNVGFDFAQVIARSRKVAEKLSNGVAYLMKKNKIAVIEGHAKLEGQGRIAVTGKDGQKLPMIAAKHIILATGARAKTLPGLEPDDRVIWTYKEAMVPETFPKSLLVVGSGAIGIEFASFYRTLGAEVTVVEILDRILPAEDEEISRLAEKSFAKQGIAIRTGTTVERLVTSGDGVTATLKTPDGRLEGSVDRVILAIGIIGNVEGLGLDEQGVRVDKGHIVVDEWCRPGVPGLYAIGDVIGPPWLAHKAMHEGVLCVEKIAGLDGVHPLDKTNVPACTYSAPQVASLGLTEAAARAAGHDLKVGRYPYYANGKAIALGEPEGLVKTIFDAKTGALLGAHMIGAEVTELIQGFAIGKTLETTEAELIATIFPHPTLSEMMHESVLDAFGRALHI